MPDPEQPSSPNPGKDDLPESQPPQVSSSNILVISLVVYLPMALTGFWVKAPGSFRLAGWPEFAGGISAAVVLGGLTVAGSRWSTHHTSWGRKLHREFAAMLGGVDARTILWLALLSAIGEEVLFRGVLQPRLGLLPTVLLFGALHFPLRPHLWPWTIFALVVGLVLGLLTEWAGTLWPAIVLHFIINHFNLHAIADGSQNPNTMEEKER